MWWSHLSNRDLFLYEDHLSKFWDSHHKDQLVIMATHQNGQNLLSIFIMGIWQWQYKRRDNNVEKIIKGLHKHSTWSYLRLLYHDDVIEWKNFPRYWPFVRGNSSVNGGFPAQRPVTRNLDVFFDLCLNKWLSKQPRGFWFEMPSWSLWCHCNVSPIYGLPGFLDVHRSSLLVCIMNTLMAHTPHHR